MLTQRRVKVNARDLFLFQFSEATVAMEKIIVAMGEAGIDIRAEDRFSPVEQIIHAVQSEKFALKFIPARMNVTPPFDLDSDFAAVAEETDREKKKTLLRKLNLKGTRGYLEKRGASVDSILGLWTKHRQKALEVFKTLPVETDDVVIGHPLVNWQAPCIGMCTILFCEPPRHHIGEIIEALKPMEFFDPPLTFGEII